MALSASGPPAGATVVFPQNPAVPGSTVPVNVNLSNVIPGSYPITISGTDGVSNVSETFTLVVNPPAAAPVFVAPSDAAANVNVLTAFDWNAVTGAASYKLEVATDVNFANIVADVTVTPTNHTLTAPLNVNTTYYWRVTAFNACGGTTPAPWSFTTWPVNAVQELDGLGVSISPNPTSGRVSAFFTKATPGKMEATLHSASGILVKNQPVPVGSLAVEFDLTGLPAGVYLLRLRGAAGFFTKKIVLEK
jgi:hypothetical protein